jgi:hypothetical protein
MVVHVFNHSTWEAERPSGLYSKILSWKKNGKEKGKRADAKYLQAEVSLNLGSLSDSQCSSFQILRYAGSPHLSLCYNLEGNGFFPITVLMNLQGGQKGVISEK